jgi:hypothetical protein
MNYITSRTLSSRITALNNALSPSAQRELIVNVVYQSLNHNDRHISQLYTAENISQAMKAEAYRICAHSTERKDGKVTLKYNKDKEAKSLDALGITEPRPTFDQVSEAMAVKWAADAAETKTSTLSLIGEKSLESQVAAFKEKAQASDYEAIESQLKLLERKVSVLKAAMVAKAMPISMVA